MNDLEKEFRAAVEEAQVRINEKLAIASAAIREAEEISEQTGVPFSSGVSALAQDYSPESFHKKWEGLDEALAQEISGTYFEYGMGNGWQHSAVCY